jgi:hypothetical protein
MCVALAGRRQSCRHLSQFRWKVPLYLGDGACRQAYGPDRVGGAAATRGCRGRCLTSTLEGTE